MGNWICAVARTAAVEDRLTKPQRLARQPSNIDYKKLRKLILSKKLAPCFDASEDPNPDLEECPICFFFYPSLNRSRCCSKGICTECFLQMKPSNPSRPAQCPFCKTSSYAVEFRGAKTKEEKELELAEERKVIEAKLRIQSRQSPEIDLICSTSAAESMIPGKLPEIGDRRSTCIDYSRFHGFDVDAEGVTVLEAIWRSLETSQGSRSQRNEDEDPDSTDESDGRQMNMLPSESLCSLGNDPMWRSERARRSAAPYLTSRYLHSGSSSPCGIPRGVDRDVSPLPGSILTVN